MVNITHKSPTLRKAIAQAVVKVSAQSTIEAIQQKLVPKGDVFEMAKAAGRSPQRSKYTPSTKQA